jgi:hypothetical protein
MGEMDESKAGENVVKFLKFLLANDKLKWFGFESVSSYGQMFNYKTTDWEGHLKIILRHVFPYKKIWADAKQTKQISAPGYAERWKPVDASLHYNYFLLEVEDPEWRFDIKIILKLDCDKNDLYFDLLSQLFETVKLKAVYIPKERLLKSQVKLQSALDTIVKNSY